MRHRWLVNGLLAITVLALAWVAVFKPGKEPAPAAKLLSSIDTNTITSIRLHRAHLGNLEFSKKDTQWRMTQPLAARANSYNIEALLRIATAETEDSFDADTQSLKKFGLEKPRQTIVLNDHEILIGDQHPLKNSRYVKYGNAIAVLPVYLTRIAETATNDFIDTRLLTEGTRLVRLKLENTELALTGGKWRISGKENKGISPDQINLFIEEWQQARALTVQKYSGRKPMQTLVLEFAGPRPEPEVLRLSILAYKPELVLWRKDEGLEYRFTADAGKRLLHLPDPEPAHDSPVNREDAGAH